VAVEKPVEVYKVRFNRNLAEWEASVLQLLDGEGDVLIGVSTADITGEQTFHCARPVQLPVSVVRWFLDYSDRKQ
jgi:hypothetical protein